MILGASHSNIKPSRPTWLASSTMTTSKASGSGSIISATCLIGMTHAGTAARASRIAERAAFRCRLPSAVIPLPAFAVADA